MIKSIVKDVKVLSKVSRPFDEEKDMQVVYDLLDTIREHHKEAAGLAAIQIGYDVCAFAMREQKSGQFIVVINPRIMQKFNQYDSVELCLSFDEPRRAKRYKKILVKDQVYIQGAWKNRSVYIDYFDAKTYQHECDHLVGKLI